MSAPMNKGLPMTAEPVAKGSVLARPNSPIRPLLRAIAPSQAGAAGGGAGDRGGAAAEEAGGVRGSVPGGTDGSGAAGPARSTIGGCGELRRRASPVLAAPAEIAGFRRLRVRSRRTAGVSPNGERGGEKGE